MKKLWTDRAWDEYLSWQEQDKKTLRKLNKLIKDIERSPYEGIGKPEPLKHDLSVMMIKYFRQERIYRHLPIFLKISFPVYQTL